jgi:hypothetical protein
LWATGASLRPCAASFHVGSRVPLPTGGSSPGSASRQAKIRASVLVMEERKSRWGRMPGERVGPLFPCGSATASSEPADACRSRAGTTLVPSPCAWELAERSTELVTGEVACAGCLVGACPGEIPRGGRLARASAPGPGTTAQREAM